MKNVQLSNCLPLIAVLFLLFPTCIYATSYTWGGSSTGNWSDPSKWSPAGVPGSADNATINSGNVTLDTDVTLLNLTLNNAAIEGTANLNVTGLMTWNAFGIFRSTGTLTIDAGAIVNWEGSNANHYNNSTMIVNGTANLNNCQISTTTGTGILTINGAFNVSAASISPVIYKQNLTVNSTLTKTGANFFIIDATNTAYVQNGNINVNGGTMQVSTDMNFGQALTIASGATFHLSGNKVRTFSASATVIVSGTLKAEGTTTFNCPVTGSGTYQTPATGTVNFNDSYTIPTTLLTGGTTLFNVSTTFAGIQLFNATLGGSGALNVTATLDWKSNGTFNGAGGLTVDAGGSLNFIDGNTTHYNNSSVIVNGTTNLTDCHINASVGSGVLTINGAFNVSATSISPVIYKQNLTVNSTLTKSGANFLVIDATNTAYVQNGNINVNGGTMQVSTDMNFGQALTIASGATFHLSGNKVRTFSALATVIVSGTLKAEGTTTFNCPVTGSGTYQTPATGTVNFNDSYTITTTLLTGGTTLFNVSTTFASLQLFNATLGGSGALNVTGTLDWKSNGTFNGAGGLTVDAGGILNFIDGNTTHYNNSSVIVNGTTNLTDCHINASVGSGVLTINGAFNVSATSVSSVIYKQNLTVNSTLTKSGANFLVIDATNTAYVQNGNINVNGGTMQVSTDMNFGQALTIASGATFHLSGNKVRTFSASATVTVSGTLKAEGTTTFDCPVTGSGTYQTPATGTVNFNDSYTITTTLLTGGTTLFNVSTTFASLQLFNATLGGSGALNVTATLDWKNNGTFNGAGGLTVDAGGILNFIDGNTTHYNNSSVIVNGTTNLTDCHINASVGSGVLTINGAFNVSATSVSSVIYKQNLTVNSTLTKSGANFFVIDATNTAYVQDGNINVNGGTMQVNKVTSITGDISISSGAILNIGVVSGLPFAGNIFTNNGTVSNNVLKFMGATAQTLAGTGSTIAALTIDNPSNVTISGTHTVSGALTFNNGKVVLQNGNLTVASVSGAGTSRYVATTGTGELRVTLVGTTAKIFHIGPNTSSYTPVSIKNNTGTNTWGARVAAVIDAGTPATGIGPVTNEWYLTKVTAATSTADLTFTWNHPTDETAGFDPTVAQLYQWNGSSWGGFSTQNVTGGCSCTLSEAGVPSLTSPGTPFIVGSNCPGFTTYYQDNDGDSYGNPAATQGACQLPVGYVLNNLDCDDSNANIKPGATEICNGADDDCDTLTDENGMTGTASGNSPVCEGSTLQLNTSSNPLALSYAWSGPNGFVSGIGNPAIHNITMAATGTYTVSMTNFGCAATAEVTIIVNANPVVSASSNSPVCENMSLQLSASGAYTYAWSGPDGYTGTGAGPAIYPVGFSAAGIYTVTGTDANGCTDTNTTEVVVNAQPEASVTSSGPLSVCPGSSLQLLANTGINLSWQWQFSADNTDWDNISGAVQSTLEVTSNGYFRVVVTNTGSGCMKSSASVEVTILDLPVAVISGDTATCAGNIATFTASGGISYIWSTGDTTAALNTAAAGDYYVIVTDINGCSDSESVTLTIRALPTALIEGLAEICEGQTTLLTATGGTSYLWSDDQTSATISADMAGTYSVTVTNNVGCTDTATFILTSLPSPEVTISGNTYLCGGDPTYLTASGGISYQWSSSESTPDISTAIPGTYTVTATGDNGCTATADIIISDATATAAITGDINICPGETTTLNAFGGVTFLWNTAANSSSLSGIGAGTYSVTVTNSQGCSDDASVTVELLDAPVAAIAGDNIICLGAQATLTATATGTPGPYSYSWSTGMTNDFSVTVAPLITTIYQVTVTAANGCTGNTLFEVEVSGHIPVMDFAGGTEFEGHIVSPVAASGYDNYTFKIKYTDADGDLPEGGFPRMFLKYNPPGNSGFDLNIPMSEADPLDQDVTDGKIYQLTLNGMNIGQNWAATFTATDAAGCTASWNPGLSEPDVLDYLDVFVYANDIVFSQAHPDTNEAIVVLTTIHNPSDFPAVDFVVRLHNDFSNEDYGTQTITLAAHATTILSWNIITPEVGSWNPIRVFIDDTGVLAETNEYNNNAVRPFICGDFELPGGISVTAAANNILYDPGANPLNLVILTGHASYFGLPPGLMLNNVGVAGADLTFSIEELGQNFYTTTDNNGNFSLVIATSMTNPGTYHINDGNVTDFSLNGDFTASFSIITGTPPSPCLLPDLSTSTSVPGGNIFPGDSRTISITVSNTGTASAPPHELRITPGSNMTPGAIEYAAIPLIPAGGSYTFDRTYTFNNTGAQTLVLAADVNNFVNECYETNNGFYNSFAVLPYLPDARVSGFSMPQPGLFCRDNEFSVTIQNAGYDLSGASVTHLNITRIADGSTLLQQDIITPALAPNATFSFSIADPFPEPASYRIDIVADYNNEVTEFNENNLFVAFANLVECQQDLDIYSYRQATKNAVYDQTGTGTTLTFPVIIGNPGQTDISDEFVLRAEILNGVTVVVQEDITINTDIPSGSTHTQTVNITNPTPGPLYTLQLTVDPGNILPESNEGNNYFGGIGLHHDYEPALMCEEREDISGEEMDFVGSVIIRDLNTPVWCWVHKRGDLKDLQLKVKFEARLKSGNTWLNLGTATIGPVTGQGTAACPNLKVFTPQPFAFPTAGLWELRVTADPLNTIIESNESNNVFLHDFSVIEQPDLATYSYYINPSHLNPNPGQAITIDMTYKNLGQIIPSGQPFQLRCLVDNNVIGTTGHPFQDFPTGATNTVQFDFTVPIDWGMSGAELHIIRVIADADTQINEVNELNNEATRAFIVGLAPDYIVESLQYSSGTILVTVKNNGSGPGANGILQLLYKDQNGTLIPIDDAQNLVLSGLSANASQQVSFAWTLPPEAIYLVARINSVNPAEFNVLNNEAETDLSVPPLVLTGTTTASCNNGANGTASIDVNGGESPFTYSWSVLSAGSNSIDGLAPGDYSVTVTDDNGSTASLELTVGGLDPPVAIITGDTNICSGESTELTASGGVSYIWSYFDLTSDIVSVSPASSDTFFVTITDVNGCSDEANVVVLVEIPTAFYPDSDGDSYGAGMPVMACIVPENHVTDNSDCNDADIDINPGATELCNSVDDDCDGILNEGYPTTTYYRDFDGDGKGNPAVSIESCYQPDGYVANATDCDDNSATACPKPSGMSSSAVTDVSATVSWGYLPCATKYRLEYRRKTPPATGWTVVYTTSPTYDITGLTGPNIQYQWRVATICSPNGIGAESGYATMQSFYTKYKVYTDADMDGFGDVNAAASYVSTMPQPGYSANQTDCDDASATTYPGAPELCNGIDDDCDLIVDEGANWYQDADGDGLGNAAVSLNACLQPSGYVANSVDCNDNSTTPVCATPANVTATGIGASFVTINWTTSPCASGYTVMYRIAPSGAFSTQFNTTGSSMMLSGLLPVTTYQARVRAKCPAPNTVTTSNWVYVTFTTNGTGLIEQVDEDISTLDPLTFGVYPNPGDGRFTLSIPGDTDGEADISVLDGFGKLIHSVRWSVYEGITVNELDLTHLPGGVYHINIRKGDMMQTKKVVIVR